MLSPLFPSRSTALLFLSLAIVDVLGTTAGPAASGAAAQTSPLLKRPSAGHVPDDATDTPPGHAEMLLYRGFARKDPELGWVAQLRAVFLERAANPGVLRRAVASVLSLPIRPHDATEKARNRNRFSYFLADTLGDRYKWIYGVDADHSQRLRAWSIRDDGAHETDSLVLNTRKSAGDVVTLQWQPPSTNATAATQTGQVFLYGQTGYSIFADIDDTIKDSHVINIPQLMDRTFNKEYQPIQHMPELFQHFRRSLATPQHPDVAFHYISSSPFALHSSLDHFIRNASYPAGPIHLGQFRFKDPMTIVKFPMLAKFKEQEARRVVKAFPQRKLLLVGDSGQKDALAFGNLMREDPTGEHYACAFILLVSGMNSRKERRVNRRSVFEKAFRDVDPARYYMFQDPRELLSVDITGGSCKPRGKRATDIGTFSDDQK